MMSRSKRVTVMMAGLFVIASGCSKDKDPVEALADYYSRTQQMGCQLALECCTDHELPQYYDITVEQIQTCAEIRQDVSEAMEVLYGPSLDSGRVVFDSGNAEGCIAAYESMTCEQHALPGGVTDGLCDDPLVPQQGPGDPCNQSYECNTGFCDGGSMMTEGVCGVLPGDGEECSTRCAEGYYCDWHTCAPLIADGEVCTFHLDCASGGCFTPEAGTDNVCGVMCDGR